VLGAIGFAGTVVATESNEFCVSCHELDYAYKGWEQSTHVNNPEGVVADCVDCHVPPQLLDLTFSKVDSLNELYSHWFKPSGPVLVAAPAAYGARAHDVCRTTTACAATWRFEPTSPKAKSPTPLRRRPPLCAVPQHFVHNLRRCIPSSAIKFLSEPRLWLQALRRLPGTLANESRSLPSRSVSCWS
jgi:hypothetical protein